MKEHYTGAELETILFSAADVILTSENPDPDNGTPFEPVNNGD